MRFYSDKRLTALALIALVIVLSGCPLENDDDGPGYELNPGLTGTWKAGGEGWSDTYIITSTTISHPDGWPAYADAQIAWIYNFSNNAGCVIIKRVEDNKYTAVYFKDLSADSALLGDAYTVAAYTQPVEVDTLEEAKAKFAPGYAELYGGGSAQTGTPLIRQ